MDYDYRFPYIFVPDYLFSRTLLWGCFFLFISFPLKPFKTSFLIYISYLKSFQGRLQINGEHLIVQYTHYKQKNVDAKPIIPFQINPISCLPCISNKIFQSPIPPIMPIMPNFQLF